MAVSQSQLRWQRILEPYSDVMQLHDCGIGGGKRDLRADDAVRLLCSFETLYGQDCLVSVVTGSQAELTEFLGTESPTSPPPQLSKALLVSDFVNLMVLGKVQCVLL